MYRHLKWSSYNSVHCTKNVKLPHENILLNTNHPLSITKINYLSILKCIHLLIYLLKIDAKNPNTYKLFLIVIMCIIFLTTH